MRIINYEGIIRYFILPTAELCLNYIYTDYGEFDKIIRYAAGKGFHWRFRSEKKLIDTINT